ncbi:MAG: CRISPR-associated helicase Cas3' [Acidobacteriota bacterium]
MASLDEFKSISGYEPNPMQTLMWELVTGDDCATLLKSATGTGKTEAVVVPSLWTVLNAQAKRRLFMIYPARSLVEDQMGRIDSLLAKLSSKGNRLSFVVDTGAASQRHIYENGGRVEGSLLNPRRHLYDGDIIVSTLDKFLYRFFGFGEERKSYIFPFRIFHGLRRNLFVFDEAHSYEDTAFTNFIRLLKALYSAGLDVVVMTATMPDSYQRELHFLGKPVDFVAERCDEMRTWRERMDLSADFSKTLCYVPLSRSARSIAEAVAAEVEKRVGDGLRIIVTLERIKDAVQVWDHLKSAGQKPLLYHGRLDDYQRKKVYEELKRREANGGGYLLVTTSAIEVGCDLNADHLITEICNPASLIQRAGRCNRRGDRRGAEVVVVGDAIQDFVSEIGDEEEVKYRQVLSRKNGSLFDPGDFLEFSERHVAFDYRTEVLFDMLFEYVYEGRLENKPLHDKGLVVTRSWEPTVTLTTDKESMRHAVNVPISRCATTRDRVDSNCRVYVRYFNRKWGNEYEIALKELAWGGWAYFRDLVIEVQRDAFDASRGWVDVPKPFVWGRRDGYRQELRYPRSNGEKKDVRLYYLSWRPDAEEEAPSAREDERSDGGGDGLDEQEPS